MSRSGPHDVDATGGRRAVVAETVAYLVSAVGALLGAVLTLDARPGNLTRPWYDVADALQLQSAMKGVLDHGWMWNNPDLGSPGGLRVSDFAPFNGDVTQALIVRTYDLFVDGVFTAANLFLLTTFPLVAVAAFWALRRLCVSRWVSVVLAVLYALLPFHFERNLAHSSYSAYYTIPLLCVMLLDVLAGRPLFQANTRANWFARWCTVPSVRTVVFCVLIGATTSYYAAFALVLLPIAALLRAIAARSWRGLVTGLLAALLVALTLVLVQAPLIINRTDASANPLLGQRLANESEAYGLKLDQLVFPIAEHRVAPLAELAQDLEGTTRIPSEPAANLGLVGTVGLVWLLIVALASLVGGRDHRVGTDEERRAALMTLVTFVVATVGGGSAVLAYLVTAQIRAWNRMSVIIAFYSLLAVGYLLDRAARRLRAGGDQGRRSWQVAGGVALALLLIVGALDQTSPRHTPDHERLAADDDKFDRLVAETSAAFSDDARILQLPYVLYPEEGDVNAMGGYQHLRMDLGSQGLEFSFPANKGTEGDWLGPIQSAPLPVLLDAATALGFDAVYVDRLGYADRGEILEAALDDALGEAVVRSTDDRYLIWDLRDRRTDLRARVGRRGVEAIRAAATEPVRAFLDEGFGSVSIAIGRGSRDGLPESEITLENGRDAPRRAVFTADLSSVPNGASSVTLAFPDGTRRRVALGDERVTVRHVFTVPAGQSTIRLVSRGIPEIDMRDTGSWHGAVGVPTTFDERAVVRVSAPSLIPVEVCAGQATAGRSASDACTEGPNPQAP